MAWMNYREIQDRFGHIDAEFVRSDVSLSPQGSHASVTVRFYPWWEHPGYLKARETGTAWGFTQAVEAGRQNVTVKAVVPYAARISQRVEVTDWGFSEEHPLLWDFAQEVTIYVNGHFDVLHLTERVLDRHMPFVTRRELERYFDPTWRPVPSRGIRIPAQLYANTVESLTEMNVAVLPGEAPPIPRMTVFLLDEDDYIVAEDFAVDVPEFKHDPGWFAPSVPNVNG
jgi:hypothetical protein